jgi:monoterpene epsilon-lactone hydrolase
MPIQRPSMTVPAREIPVPTTASEQAQAVLATELPVEPLPPVEDVDAVKAVIARRDGMAGPLIASIYGSASTGVEAEVERIELDGCGVYVATPAGVSADDRRVYLFIHGAWISGGGEMARAGAAMTAGAVGARTWAVDYRMPPDHPFPAPLDDCLSAYRALLVDHAPEEIIIGGMSGGANLTLATILRARAEGLPLPAAAVVLTPPADLTKAGDTFTTNADVDVSYDPGDIERIIQLYLNGHDRLDPYVSPVYGDFGKGFPPTILTSGTRDFLLSDTVRVHRRLRDAGVEAELHVWEATPHFMFMGMAPEDLERVHEVRRFLDLHWPPVAPSADRAPAAGVPARDTEARRGPS